jgi:hypothetical protein
MRLKLESPDASAPAFLHLALPSSSGPGSYPDVPPVIGVSCEGLAPPLLLRLTQLLWEHCEQLLGAPMAHGLAVQLLEALPDLPPDTPMPQVFRWAGGPG